MSKLNGYVTAISNAREKLRETGFKVKGASFSVSFLGKSLCIDPETFRITVRTTGTPVSPVDEILVLHYLLYEKPAVSTGEIVAFRDFPGGAFYRQPFLNRSVNPLVKRFNNNIEELKKKLNRFSWEPYYSKGDFGGKISAIGPLYVYLVYNLGDNEFPAEAHFYFDKCFTDIYSTEDAAVFAQRICLGLL